MMKSQLDNLQLINRPEEPNATDNNQTSNMCEANKKAASSQPAADMINLYLSSSSAIKSANKMTTDRKWKPMLGGQQAALAAADKFAQTMYKITSMQLYSNRRYSNTSRRRQRQATSWPLLDSKLSTSLASLLVACIALTFFCNFIALSQASELAASSDATSNKLSSSTSVDRSDLAGSASTPSSSSVVASLSSAVASAAAAAAVAAAQSSLSGSDARSLSSSSASQQSHQQRSSGLNLAMKLADAIPEVPYNILHNMKKLDHAAPFYNVPNKLHSSGHSKESSTQSLLVSALQASSSPLADQLGNLFRSPIWKRIADSYGDFTSEFRSLFRAPAATPMKGASSSATKLLRDISVPALLMLIASAIPGELRPVRTRRKSPLLGAELANLGLAAQEPQVAAMSQLLQRPMFGGRQADSPLFGPQMDHQLQSANHQLARSADINLEGVEQSGWLSHQNQPLEQNALRSQLNQMQQQRTDATQSQQLPIRRFGELQKPVKSVESSASPATTNPLFGSLTSSLSAQAHKIMSKLSNANGLTELAYRNLLDDSNNSQLSSSQRYTLIESDLAASTDQKPADGFARRQQPAPGTPTASVPESRKLNQLLPQSWKEAVKRTMSSVQQQASNQWRSIEGQLTNWVQDKLKSAPGAAQSSSGNGSAPVANMIASVSNTAMNMLGLGAKQSSGAAQTSQSSAKESDASNSQESGKKQESATASRATQPAKGALAGVANMIVSTLTSNRQSQSASASSSSSSSTSSSSPSSPAAKSSSGGHNSNESASQYPTITSNGNSAHPST